MFFINLVGYILLHVFIQYIYAKLCIWLYKDLVYSPTPHIQYRIAVHDRVADLCHFKRNFLLTLLEKFWRISLHVTDESVAKIYVNEILAPDQWFLKVLCLEFLCGSGFGIKSTDPTGSSVLAEKATWLDNIRSQYLTGPCNVCLVSPRIPLIKNCSFLHK